MEEAKKVERTELTGVHSLVLCRSPFPSQYVFPFSTGGAGTTIPVSKKWAGSRNVVHFCSKQNNKRTSVIHATDIAGWRRKGAEACEFYCVLLFLVCTCTARTSAATYLVENGAVAVEQRSVADVGMADHPAQVRRRPPDLRQVPEGKSMYMIRISVSLCWLNCINIILNLICSFKCILNWG